MSPLNQSLIHAIKVAAFIVGSAVIPALISLYAGNATWMALFPVLNVIASFLVKYSEVKTSQPIQ